MSVNLSGASVCNETSYPITEFETASLTPGRNPEALLLPGGEARRPNPLQEVQYKGWSEKARLLNLSKPPL